MHARHLVAAAALAGLSGSIAVAQPAASTKLRLVCEGVQQTAEAPDYHPRLAHEGGPAAGSSPGIETRMASSRQRMQIEIDGGSGRLRPPLALLGAHRTRTGNGGWLPLTDLVVGEEEITGRYKLSVFTTARLRIDRQTGEVSSRGGGDFTGMCDRASDTPPPRKF